MKCLYCDRSLGILRFRSPEPYCSREHRTLHYRRRDPPVAGALGSKPRLIDQQFAPSMDLSISGANEHLPTHSWASRTLGNPGITSIGFVVDPPRAASSARHFQNGTAHDPFAFRPVLPSTEHPSSTAHLRMAISVVSAFRPNLRLAPPDSRAAWTDPDHCSSPVDSDPRFESLLSNLPGSMPECRLDTCLQPSWPSGVPGGDEGWSALVYSATAHPVTSALPAFVGSWRIFPPALSRSAAASLSVKPSSNIYLHVISTSEASVPVAATLGSRRLLAPFDVYWLPEASTLSPCLDHARSEVIPCAKRFAVPQLRSSTLFLLRIRSSPSKSGSACKLAVPYKARPQELVSVNPRCTSHIFDSHGFKPTRARSASTFAPILPDLPRSSRRSSTPTENTSS